MSTGAASPMTVPTFTSTTSQPSRSEACNSAVEIGEAELSVGYGASPVITSAIETYSTTQMASARSRARGRSRAGSRLSRAAVDIASKPEYEKNAMAAAVSTPPQPNLPESFSGGTNGVQFSGDTYAAPNSTTIT